MYVTTLSLFDMSLYRDPEIRNYLSKLTKSQLTYYCFNPILTQQSVTLFILGYFNNIQISKLKTNKIKPKVGFPRFVGHGVIKHMRYRMLKTGEIACKTNRYI